MKNYINILLCVSALIISLTGCNNRENLGNVENSGETNNILQSGDILQEENVENVEKVSAVDVLTSNKWVCYKVTDFQANELDLYTIFGSLYRDSRGWLTFNTDGTFEHIKPGGAGASDEVPTTGEYILEGDDLYLTYSDESGTVGKVYISLDEATPHELSVNEYYADGSGYRMYFKTEK